MSFLGALFSGPNVQQVTQNAGVQNANQQAQNVINQQQAFANALAGQGGLQNQQNVFNQLQQIASGQGPNPAQAMLAQATGQNVANQAALMANQRGVNANPALLARQAAQQGAATQQQAAGQGAIMQANQSLGALGQLGGLANTEVAQQQAGLGQLSGMSQAQQAALAGQINAQNQANLGVYNAELGPAMQVVGAGLKAGSTALAGAKAKGGEIPEYAAGGPIFASTQNQQAGLKENYKGKKRFIDHFFDGGMAKDMRIGGHVPGKAMVGGARDSYTNDTVSAMLSPGEIVLPRSVTKSANPSEAAKKFVEALNKKKKGK